MTARRQDAWDAAGPWLQRGTQALACAVYSTSLCTGSWTRRLCTTSAHDAADRGHAQLAGSAGHGQAAMICTVMPAGSAGSQLCAERRWHTCVCAGPSVLRALRRSVAPMAPLPPPAGSACRPHCSRHSSTDPSLTLACVCWHAQCRYFIDQHDCMQPKPGCGAPRCSAVLQNSVASCAMSE